MIRLLVVDDHAIVRQGLARLFATAPDIELVGLAGDGNEALHAIAHERPDVVLMDLAMPVLGGVGATRLIADHDPTVRIVVLTGSAGSLVDEALAAGACAVVFKDAPADELLAAVRAVSPAPRPAPPAGDERRRGSLSPRETEVLGLLTAGRSNRQIACALEISEGTVKAHLTRVFRVIGVADRVQAALWGREHLAHHGS
jgi:DNA-binding NarL/FixJ family response regulator